MLSSQTCKHCGNTNAGKYCSACAQSFAVKRITVPGILHEIFHLFTHLDKGFVYTLKKLITHPGTMQKEYIEGHRVKHQKPFSMFFLCATFSALVYYWTNTALIRYYNESDETTAYFFQHYMVILQMLMIPVYAGITWLIFYPSKYNYAEVVIQLLYMLSILLLIVALIQLLRLIWPGLETRFIELPVLLVYGILTNINFFTEGKRWLIMIRSVLAIVAAFTLSGLMQYLFIEVWL